MNKRRSIYKGFNKRRKNRVIKIYIVGASICLICGYGYIQFKNSNMFNSIKEKVASIELKVPFFDLKKSNDNGLETFDYDFRENYLVKGIDEKNPKIIAEYFDEINLLQGIEGQTAESMIWDIEMGLKHFKRVYVNIMTENKMPIKPDKMVIEQFRTKVYPRFKDNDKVDILLENTDFGVGENKC